MEHSWREVQEGKEPQVDGLLRDKLVDIFTLEILWYDFKDLLMHYVSD